jgi:flagellum-specific peptidoglycan hydrolase FlgJ
MERRELVLRPTELLCLLTVLALAIALWKSDPGGSLVSAQGLQDELTVGSHPLEIAAQKQAPTQKGAAPLSPPRLDAVVYAIRGSSTEQEFIAAISGPAQQSQRETGVPASVTMAQAIVESNWGKSQLASTANNYFGIKAKGRAGTAGTISLPTWEVFGGSDVTIVDAFRAYNSPTESFIDHGRFFHENRRYAQALRTSSDPREFARQIHAAGYATDPQYANKLINMMDRFDLYRFDSVGA